MGKSKFGVDQFSKHPPKWLVPTLAGIIVVSGVLSFLITGDPAISNELKVRINHYITGFTMLVSGLAPLFGVDPSHVEPKRRPPHNREDIGIGA